MTIKIYTYLETHQENILKICTNFHIQFQALKYIGYKQHQSYKESFLKLITIYISLTFRLSKNFATDYPQP